MFCRILNFNKSLLMHSCIKNLYKFASVIVRKYKYTLITAYVIDKYTY